MLKYDREAVATAVGLGEVGEEEGIEGAFEVRRSEEIALFVF